MDNPQNSAGEGGREAPPFVMDPSHAKEAFELLEKQEEILTEAYSTLSHELHNLQVEEEMLMKKFYEFMSAQGLNFKDKNEGNSSGANLGKSAPVSHDHPPGVS